MFDSPFELFSLLIAIVAFIVARKALNQAGMLRARLDAMDAAAGQARPVTPPPKQTPAAASLSERIVKRPISPRWRTCVPPQSSTEYGL